MPLAGGFLVAHQGIHRHRLGHQATQRLRQQSGLVEAPGKQPRPVQRHRHQDVGGGQKFAPRLGQPLRQQLRQVGSVRMFKAQDEILRCAVVQQRRAGLGKRRAVAHAGTAQRQPRHFVLERMTAGVATRLRDEAQLGPTGRAQHVLPLRHLVAPSTGGGQHQVEKLAQNRRHAIRLQLHPPQS